jgi:hypothetical protein
MEPASNPGRRRRSARRLTVCAMAVTLWASTALGISPESAGEPVASIPGANSINGWSTLDNQQVLVNLDEQNVYLLKLKHQCHGLGWAQDISVSMSNNTIWAGFDAIRADGRICPIHSIRKLSPEALLEDGY